MYEYYGVELTPAVMKELLIKLFDGKQFKRNDAINKIIEYHKKNGGVLSSKDYTGVFKASTKWLKESGLINCGYGMWRLNYEKQEIEIEEVSKTKEINYVVDETIGDGDYSVYVYYYDIYKKYALEKNEIYFPCKIGRTDCDPIQRILGQCGTCYPEMPHISLIINCDDSSKLENAIHSILKYQNKWLEDAPGSEWFLTNPQEIKEIYNEINSKK